MLPTKVSMYARDKELKELITQKTNITFNIYSKKKTLHLTKKIFEGKKKLIIDFIIKLIEKDLIFLY